MKKKVLVTGGAGYIGAHTVVELLNAGYEVIVLDNLSRTDRTLLTGIEQITQKSPPFYEGDCTDLNFVRGIFKEHPDIQCVLHFAAFKSVGESVAQPVEYYKNNVGSLITLLIAMKEFDVTDLIFSSSCTVYGQPDNIPVDEHTPLKKAESPYGATKQFCERILEDAYTTGLRVISLRYFNPIGAHPSGQIGELPIGIPSNLVPFITQTAAGKRDRLTVFGDTYNTPDGSCIRDYIHVVDVAVAHLKAMNFLEKIPDKNVLEVFNLGTGVGSSVLELVNLFKKVTGINLPFVIGPRRSGDVEQVYANPAKLNRAFGWKTSYSMEDALKHAWQWEQNLLKKIVN